MMENMTALELMEAYGSGRRDFSRIGLMHESVAGKYLVGINLSGAYLRYTDFHGADLTGADLSDAESYYSDFRQAILEDADLSRLTNGLPSHIEGASFIGANLTDTLLSSSNHQHIAALLESQLLLDNPTSEKVATRKSAIAFIRSGKGSNLCWEGMVKHFRKAVPTELRWGLKVLASHPNMYAAQGYMQEAVYLTDDKDAEKVPEGVLSHLKARNRVAIADRSGLYYDDDPTKYAIVSVKHVYASGILEVEYGDDTLYFTPNGDQFNDENGNIKLVLITDEIKQDAEHKRLVYVISNEIDFDSLTLAQLRKIVTVMHKTE